MKMKSISPSLAHRQRTKYQRSRAVKSRVRSGCVTCKIRHVKCDETKPICNRCANAGYECDGYCYNTLARRPTSHPFQSTGSNNNNLRVAIPRAKSFLSTELIVQPSAGLRFASPIEHRCFVIFQESAASQLSGYYQSSVWDRIILQTCHQEQWARKLVVAIGALHHQSINTSTASSMESGRSGVTVVSEREKKSHYLFALQQYGAALADLRGISAQEHQTEFQLRRALVSSLLTTCFETYIGNRDTAIAQAKAGIELLFRWTNQKEPGDDSLDDWCRVRRVTKRSLYLDDDLLGAFQRLDYQLLLCRGAQPGRQIPRFPSAKKPFTSVNEACMYWDLVVRRVLHYHAVKDVTEQHHPEGFDDDHPRISGTNENIYPDHALLEQQNFKTATEQFFRYFEPIFRRSRQNPGTKEYLLANLVMIRALSCRAAVSRGPSDSEMDTDDFLRDYVFLTKLARDLIDNSRNSLQKAIFNFEITFGISLFSVAHLCREPKVRRSAIEMLNQYPQKDGWFDALIAAKVVTWIMEKEEEGMVNGHIPDTARLRLIKHEAGPQKQWVRIHYSKLVWKEGVTARERLPPVTIT